jgi:molybdopterin synthase sulfur carrier subunit
MSGKNRADVHFFAAARAAVGTSALQVGGETLAEICDAIEMDHPSFAKVRPQCSYLIDAVAVHGDPHQVTVPAGARIDVLPPFAGG